MANLTIGISDLKVCRPPDVLVTYALGSCVGICLLDSVAGVGGLSHIMLPDSTQATNGAATPMRFADTAIPMLIREMVKLIETQRAYQISSRVVTTSDEFTRLANNLR